MPFSQHRWGPPSKSPVGLSSPWLRECSLQLQDFQLKHLLCCSLQVLANYRKLLHYHITDQPRASQC